MYTVLVSFALHEGVFSGNTQNPMRPQYIENFFDIAFLKVQNI